MLLLQVKLLKCLIEDVVVDISFETIGGLRAATFLTSMDLEISKRCRGDCLFIRSVILVRAVSGVPAVIPELVAAPPLLQRSREHILRCGVRTHVSAFLVENVPAHDLFNTFLMILCRD